MKHSGKIARLGFHYRNAAGHMLDEGRSQQEIADWINEEMRKMGVGDDGEAQEPVTQQNVSTWQKNGYKEWKDANAAREIAASLKGVENPDWMDDLADTAENLARWIGAKLVARLTELESAEKRPDDYWRQINEIAQTLYNLRRANHENEWLKLENKRVHVAEQKWRETQENRSPDVKAVRILAGLEKP